MILIKNIEFLEVDRNHYEMASMKSPFSAVEVFSDKGNTAVNTSEIRELIVGRRFFRSSDNTDVYIGMSKQAQDVIGIQYEAWDELSASYNSTHAQLMKVSEKSAKYKEELDKIIDMGFFERLKFLFSSYK